jgi:pimeloyl-ACP methyl ester carboxylesterase
LSDAPTASETQNPVIVVPGIRLPFWLPGVDPDADEKWEYFQEQLAFYGGVDVYAVDLTDMWAPQGRNVSDAQIIGSKIAEVLGNYPEGTKVDVIGFSMGGLSARYYIKNLGGDDYVDDYISLDTPQHGAEAMFGWPTETTLAIKDFWPDGPLMTALNGDENECPGDVYYSAFFADYNAGSYLNCGEVNYEFYGLGHMEFLTNPFVLNFVINIID